MDFAKFVKWSTKNRQVGELDTSAKPAQVENFSTTDGFWKVSNSYTCLIFVLDFDLRETKNRLRSVTTSAAGSAAGSREASGVGASQ